MHLEQDEVGRNEEAGEDEAKISGTEWAGVRAEAEKSEGDEGCKDGSGEDTVDEEMHMSAVEEAK